MSDKFKYTAGLHNVGSYLVAGSPYVTSSTVELGEEKQITFPRVTNNVNVKVESLHASIAISGTVFAKTADQIYTTDGHNYSVTMWVSASNDLATNDQETVFSFASSPSANGRNMLKEKNGKWQFIIQNVGGTVASVASPANNIPAGWQFVACVAQGTSTSITASVSINAATSGGNFGEDKDAGGPIDNTVNDSHFTVGPVAQGRDDGAAIKIRDVILWNGALTTGNITTLYNSGQYYSPSQFTDFEKLVWIKDNLVSTAPQNFGISGSTFSLDGFGGSDIFEESNDSPFNSSGGSLRIHYRSTGSLPNVANRKHYWTLDSNNEEIKMGVKTKEVYLSALDGGCDFSVHADLTNIPTARMYEHTGSGVDE